MGIVPIIKKRGYGRMTLYRNIIFDGLKEEISYCMHDIIEKNMMQHGCVEAEFVTHNYYNFSTKLKFHENTRLVGKIIEKTSLTNFY